MKSSFVVLWIVADSQGLSSGGVDSRDAGNLSLILGHQQPQQQSPINYLLCIYFVKLSLFSCFFLLMVCNLDLAGLYFLGADHVALLLFISTVRCTIIFVFTRANQLPKT